MSTNRERLLKLLRGEDPGEIIVCPLNDSWVLEPSLGKAEAPGMDEYRMAAKLQGPIEDQLRQGEIAGYEPIALQGVDWSLGNPRLVWREERVHEDSRRRLRVERLILSTPHGDIVRRRESTPISSRVTDESPITAEQRHRIIDWYADERLACDLESVAKQIQGYVAIRGERGLLCTGVTGPWGLFGLLGTDLDAGVYHSMDYPEEHRRLAGKLLDLAVFEADVLLANGYDLVWAGGIGGTTYTSPKYYRQTAMPYDKAIMDHVRGKGGLIYTHDCGKVATMIREGLYNETLPSLLETLAPPPVGDVDDLRAYRRMLDPAICTKGNIDVGFLLNATVEEVRVATLEVIEATKGYRHMVGTGDDVFDGTPLENLKAMVEVAKNYTGRHFPSATV